MPVCAVLGGQWGDEGKGKIVDVLAEKAHVGARFSGGNNAGHTVKNSDGTFKLHLIPSGIFWPQSIAVIGNGSATAIHPHDDNEVDLGSSSYEYKDLYLDGTEYTDGRTASGTPGNAGAHVTFDFTVGNPATTLYIYDGTTGTASNCGYVGTERAISTSSSAVNNLSESLISPTKKRSFLSSKSDSISICLLSFLL